MPIEILSQQDIYNKNKVIIFNSTNGAIQPEQDPVVIAWNTASANMAYSAQLAAQDGINQLFPQTATDEAFISQIALTSTNNNIRRKQATFAQGQLVLTANAAADIPAGTQFITSDGQVYNSLVTQTVSAQPFSIPSLSRVSGFAIANVPNHGLGNGMTISISGATPNEFNGDQEIEVLSVDSFRYPNVGIDEGATGTIVGNFYGCRVTVQSLNASYQANKSYTDAITLASGITQIDDTYITFNGIIGGTDIEPLIEGFRARIIEYLAFPQNKGNRFQYQSYIKQNTSANFAYFFAIVDSLTINLVGVISTYDTNFNFTDFTLDQLTDITAKFIADNQILLGIEAVNLQITNPTFVPINISIPSLLPNTLAMKDAVTQILKEYIGRLAVNYYLSPEHSELSVTKIAQIAGMARDNQGNTPTFATPIVTGVSALDADIKKPILGTISW